MSQLCYIKFSFIGFISFQMQDPVTESDKPADGLRLRTVELSTSRYEDVHHPTARRTPAVCNLKHNDNR